MAKLVVEKGRDKGKVLVLKDSQVFLIGRDIKTHLKLRDHQASRRHLKITTRPGEALLEDLDSSNGTFVNGERVRSWKLAAGDKVLVGETLIFYLADESEDSVTETQTVDTLAATGPRKGELSAREVSGYRIGRLLGRGGMGTVYEAIQISLDRRVAFKVLAAELAADQQFVDRFTAEARAAGSLNHPNIVQVYDVGFANDIRFYSMEYMAKGSVEDLLRKHGKLPVGHALAVTFDAARGLEYAERKHIVHRDIKPENLMISEDDVVKIGDLGIATQRRPGHAGGADETVSGSPHYIAPEQALGKSFDHRADLYALGVSLYQILCGETPYEGASAREVILKHLNEPAPPLGPRAPETPPEVLSLVERLMDKDPDKRPPSASVLLQELVPLLRAHPITDETAGKLDGFLAKRLELSISGIAAAPRVPSGRVAPASTETNVLALKSTDKSPQAAAPTAPRSPALRQALALLGAFLAAVAFGAGVFWLAATLRAKKQRLHEERAALVVETRKLLEKDPKDCEQKALGLELRFRAEGDEEEARDAHALAADAKNKRLQAEAAAREAQAQAELDAIHKALDAFASDAADVEGIKKLETAVADLEPLSKKYGGTAAGGKAATELAQATKQLETGRIARVERLRDEAEIDVESKRQWAGIEELCRSGRYDDAWLLFTNFRDAPHPTPARKSASERLHGKLEETFKPQIDGAIKEAERFVRAGDFRRARLAVKQQLDRLQKLDDIATPLRQEMDRIDRAEKAASDSPEGQDERLLERAETEARSAIQKRKFLDAVAVFRKARGQAQSDDGAGTLSWRAERSELSGQLLAYFFDTVRQRHEGAQIVCDFSFDGRLAHCVAFEVDEPTLLVRFHEVDDARNTVDRKLEDVSDADVLDWALQAVGDRLPHLLEGAALALDLGRPDRARKLLDTWTSRVPASVKSGDRAIAQKLRADAQRAK